MMSISPLTSAVAANAYFTELRAEDYYLQDGEHGGQWCGEGIASLGLKDFTPEALSAALTGYHPISGQALVQKAGEAHRPGWDCTLSAPKSFSILYASAPAEIRALLERAHVQAVQTALRFLEQRALRSRRGKAGRTHEQSAGMIAATFTHTTSRLLDPQVHTHCVIANLAPRTDGTMGAIESKAIYEWKMAAGAVYRAELAAKLIELGFTPEKDKTSFRISGVPRPLEKIFSKRRAEIEKVLSDSNTTSARSSEIAALTTRKAKTEMQFSELREIWHSEIQACGYAPGTLHELALQDRAHQKSEIPHPRPIREILRELTERQSIFQEQDLYRVLAVDAQMSATGLVGIERHAQEIIQSPDVVRLTNSRGDVRYTTQEMLNIESNLMQDILQHGERCKHLLTMDQMAPKRKYSQLSKEQLEGISHCCQYSDVSAINGIAGSGKSTLVRAVRDCYESADYTVLGLALSGKAAQSLEEGSGTRSQTIHSFLDECDRQGKTLSERTVVIVDEAAMVGSRLMARLHSVVYRSKSKFILVGDTRQLQPIDAGGIYRSIINKLGCASLTVILRQQAEWAIDIVKDFARGRAELALGVLRQKSLYTEAADPTALQSGMVRDWGTAISIQRQPGRTLMLAGTIGETNALNLLARSYLRERGRLSADDVTDANGRAWAANDRILFLRNKKVVGVKNGDLGTVTSVVRRADGLHFVVQLDSGRTVRFGTEYYTHIDHGYAVTVHKAQGTTVDRAFVLLNEQMSDREWSYVAASRARETTHMYALKGTENDLSFALSKSHQKSTSLDYSIDKGAEHEEER